MHQQSTPVLAPSTTTGFRSIEAVPRRIADIAMLRGLGYSYREIGKQFGVTPQAISLMLARHRRSFKSLGDAVELRHLSARAVNILGRHGIRTLDEARRSGMLAVLGSERNCGRKTIEEIAHWMGRAEEPVLIDPGDAGTSSSA